MIALLAETTYDELFGSPLTPLYMLCTLVGMVVGVAYLVFAVARWGWEDLSFRRRRRAYYRSRRES